MKQQNGDERKKRHVRLQESDDIRKENLLPNKDEEESEDHKNSFESESLEKHVHQLMQNKLNNKYIFPTTNHMKFDTLVLDKEESDARADNQKDNLEEWYINTKSKMVEFSQTKDSINIDDIRSKNQQKLLLESLKEKFRTPSLDQNILNSILQTEIPGEVKKQPAPIMLIPKSKPLDSSLPLVNNSHDVSVRLPLSPARQFQVDDQFAPRRQTVFNANQANNQGNMCASLSLLQQYNPNKEYVNPELVKKENVQNLVKKIIQDKMRKMMVNPKQAQLGQQTSDNLGVSVSNQTLKNFKNLRKYFKYGQKIDYDSLLSNIVMNNHLPHKLFNFSQEELNPISTFKNIEPELYQRYLAICRAIEETKSKQHIFRKEVSDMIEQLNHYSILLTATENSTQDLNTQANNLDKLLKRTGQSMQKIDLKPKGEVAQYEIDRLTQRLNEIRKEQQNVPEKIKELNQVVKTLQSDIKRMNQQLQEIEQEEEHLKTTRQNLKTYLRDNYIKMLSKDLEMINTPKKENISLVWVIKQLRHLGENVSKLPFPQYLDSSSCEYLQQAAVIEQDIDNLRSEMKNWDFSKTDTQDKKRERKEKVLASLNKNSAKQEVLQKLKTIKQAGLKVTKPIFEIQENTHNYDIQWVNNTPNLYISQTRIEDSKSDDDDEDAKQQSVQEKQRIIDQINALQQQYLKLKNQEQMRLIQLNEKYEDALLLKKFISLFGTLEGAEEHHNYVNLNQCFLKKIQQNKNFSFMSRNRAFKISNSIKSPERYPNSLIDQRKNSIQSKSNQNSFRESQPKLNKTLYHDSSLKLLDHSQILQPDQDIYGSFKGISDNNSVISTQKLSSKQNLFKLTNVQSFNSLAEKYSNTITKTKVILPFSSTSSNTASLKNIGNSDAFDQFMRIKPRPINPRTTNFLKSTQQFPSQPSSPLIFHKI